MGSSTYPRELLGLITRAKKLAKQYYALTKRPLGVTAEIAEYEAVRLLGLELSPPRQAGYDAFEKRKGRKIRLQIKGRRLDENKSGRLGSIKLTHQFDAVLLVLLNEDFNASDIYKASRKAIEKALSIPGRAHKRGALSIRHFKRIAKLIWPTSPA